MNTWPQDAILGQYLEHLEHKLQHFEYFEHLGIRVNNTENGRPSVTPTLARHSLPCKDANLRQSDDKTNAQPKILI